MSRSVFKFLIFLPAILLLSVTPSQAQTLSRCQPSPPLPAHPKPGVNDVVFSKDGKTLVVAGSDGKIRLLDGVSGLEQRTFSGHTNAIYMTVFSPDEKLLASSSRDLTARVWDLASGRELHKFTGFRCAVKTVAFSPDGRRIAASGNDGMIKIWDLKSEKELHSLVHINSADVDMSVYSIAFDRTGKKIYGANGDGTISEWDIAKQKETRVWKAHDGNTFQIRFNRDYSLLASSGFDATVKLWHTSDWHEVRQMSFAHREAAVNIPSAGLAFSNDGKLIAAGSNGFDEKQTKYVYVEATVWNVETGEKLWTIEGQKFDINGLTFTRDDKFLLTGSVDQTIKFSDMKTGVSTRTVAMPIP
jgi:WD40 repeat protein